MEKCSANQKLIRPMTSQEKDLALKPLCLWDPLGIYWCNHYVFPPTVETCESCIACNIAEALENDSGSEAMRYFLEFKRLVKEQYVKKE